MRIRGQAERGSALVLSIVIAFIVIGIAGTYLTLSILNQNNVFRTSAATQALYTAESAAATFIQSLNSPGAPSVPAASTGSLGAASFVVTPTAYGSDGVDNDGANGVDDAFEDRFLRLDVEGRHMGQVRHLRVIVTKDPGGAFWNAIFAGNASGSDDYTMTFSSNASGTQKDIVKGDIYTGGKLAHLNHAQLLNSTGSGASEQIMYGSDDKDGLTATSTQNPAPQYVHGGQPNLDIKSMNYDLKAAAAAAGDTASPYYDPNFVNVTDRIEKYGSNGYQLGQNGPNQGTGVAKQITDANDPAHIFRLDPKDNGKDERVSTYSKMDTAKPDYFLEDPTRKHGVGSAGGNWLGSDGGQRINVTPNNNEKVYYIDGNLWVSNITAYTFQFENNTGGDMKMTFIVKGNVYLTDNLVYDIKQKNDALAIIAIGDDKQANREPADYLPGGAHYSSSSMSGLSGAEQFEKAQQLARDYNKVHGSGNIFFGDPGSGTTERFEAFMYAENNFYDHNMGASGTNETNIRGNMTAGNHVQIQRQTGTKTYKPMRVQFDDRIRAGKVTLPGLPGNPSVAGSEWLVASWNIDPKDRTTGF